MPDEHRCLVTGATGNTGAHVVAGLRQHRCRARAASRRPAPGDEDAVVFDWADTSTFTQALDGVSGVYLVAPTGVADPVPLVRPFLERAAADGVRRVVQLSSSAVAHGEPGLGEIHAIVAKLFAQFTILRPSWFMQNFVGDHPLAEGIRRSRRAITATGDGRLGFIDAVDIAAVAVQALISPEPLNSELLLTGPESMSYRQAAAVVSDVLGDAVEHIDLTTEELATRLTDSGASREFAAGLAALDARTRAGDQDFVTTTVHNVTGRAPTSLRDFLSAHIALLIKESAKMDV
jgi:uncharacterized protein YbjT (DUF2867 family)